MRYYYILRLSRRLDSANRFLNLKPKLTFRRDGTQESQTGGRGVETAGVGGVLMLSKVWRGRGRSTSNVPDVDDVLEVIDEEEDDG